VTTYSKRLATAGSVSQVESRQVRVAAEQGSSPRQVVPGNLLDQVGGFDLFERRRAPARVRGGRG
jgi:hypothetical protein